ncbi:hypothetical protein SAMN05660284_00262 [Formivibrio citricus]|uniref:Uncharacterized protein n=1 Tax=Formivibrio citricus TaxID=83765 RepID=A0A1I4VL05_9NEIS|nr:hypothetical protein SAMN05660284_00262 [Formivibrio citricus]
MDRTGLHWNTSRPNISVTRSPARIAANLSLQAPQQRRSLPPPCPFFGVTGVTGVTALIYIDIFCVAGVAVGVTGNTLIVQTRPEIAKGWIFPPLFHTRNPAAPDSASRQSSPHSHSLGDTQYTRGFPIPGTAFCLDALPSPPGSKIPRSTSSRFALRGSKPFRTSPVHACGRT